MILSFKPQLVTPILNEIKLHTIREDKYNRWHEGMEIQCATGVRTKDYQCFAHRTCTGTQSITLRDLKHSGAIILIDHTMIEPFRFSKDYFILKQLATNDGFKTVTEFIEWFQAGFKGKIIHWTDFRY